MNNGRRELANTAATFSAYFSDSGARQITDLIIPMFKLFILRQKLLIIFKTR
jgi:hypothetical protein